MTEAPATAPRVPCPHEEATERASHDAREEEERAEGAGGRTLVAVPLEQRDDPVRGDDGDAERRRVERAEAKEPAIGDEAGGQPSR